MIITGISHCDFTAADTHERIQGYNLYFSEPIPPDNGVGDKSLSVFCSIKKMSEEYFRYFENKTPCVPSYNRYGKFDRVILI